MPIRYEIDADRRLVHTIAEGCVTFAEMRDYQSQLEADPAFDANFDQIIDFTAAADVHLTTEQVMTLGRRCIFSQRSRRALAATKPAVFGWGRAWKAYHENKFPNEVEVFYSFDAAMEWLGRSARACGKSAP
ncbi:MAG TPA: hypothetical protein VML19_29315 [Verrucomicrobiae bacterium]|nr:hypothetical protein [Verrucomicrobiae bacterium]